MSPYAIGGGLERPVRDDYFGAGIDLSIAPRDPPLLACGEGDEMSGVEGFGRGDWVSLPAQTLSMSTAIPCPPPMQALPIA